MIPILPYLLDTPPMLSHAATLGEYRAIAEPRMRLFTSSVDRAIAAGFAADRLGYAFAGAYEAALHRLVPALPLDVPACLCATEENGGHPSAMTTRLWQTSDGAWSVTGKKTWATLADARSNLLVVATLGAGPSGKNRLKVVRIPANRAGVTVNVRPAMPFAPEIPHAEVVLEAVAVAGGEILEGDGYDRYVKPFRTIEDIHVLAAVLGYLVAVGRAFAFDRSVIESALVDLVALRALGDEDPSRREVHLVLGGLLANSKARLATMASEWQKAPAEIFTMWERDRAILDIAVGARKKRLEAARAGV